MAERDRQWVDMSYSGISVGSSFPVSQRPIRVYPIAAMSRKNKGSAYPQMLDAITIILSNHEGENGLIHTVSYDLNTYLFDHLIQKHTNLITYRSSSDRQQKIDQFIYTVEPTVMLAPSLDRGIDLPDNTCRFIVICKIPFPSLGTKQVSARLYSKGGQLWYNVRTIRSLVQMTGRGMRNENDYCVSYVLDKQFVTLIWRRNKHLLPDWWKAALAMNSGVLTRKEKV